MLGERIKELYTIADFPLLSIVVATENDYYIIKHDEFFFKLPNYVPEEENILPKEFKNKVIIDVISDCEMVVIVLENNYYISRSWSLVTGDGQFFEALSFENDFNNFFESEEERNGFYSLRNGSK